MLSCTISTRQQTDKTEELQSVLLPAASGAMQVLSGHAESFILLEKGKIVFENGDGSRQERKIGGGVCHVVNNHLTIIL